MENIMKNPVDPLYWKPGDIVTLYNRGAISACVVILSGNSKDGFDWCYHDNFTPEKINRSSGVNNWTPDRSSLDRNEWSVQQAKTENPMEKFAREQCQ